MTSNICPFFGRCGGCVYQDLPFTDYLDKKNNFIKRAFADFGLLITLEKFKTVPIGSRRRACFAFYKGHLGFNEMKSHKVVDIDNCAMLTPGLNSIIHSLRLLVQQLGGAGDIFVLDTPFGIDMHIKMGKEKPGLSQLEMLADFAQKNNVARLYFNNEPVMEKVALPFPADVFLQPSQWGEKILIDLMLDEIKGVQTAVDLFCGTGTFTRPLIEKGIKVLGFDSQAQSTAVLGPYGRQRDLFRNPLMPSEFDGIDMVVLDPPRAGAKAQVEQLALTHVPKIIMISCNPSTAARDIKTLTDGGYKIEKITPVDQFTYSNHVELVCVLSK